MNAAVSASVVLASRLQTDISVFSFMLFAAQSFALLPVLRQRLQVCKILVIWLRSHSVNLATSSAFFGVYLSYYVAFVCRVAQILTCTCSCHSSGPCNIWFTRGARMEPEIQEVRRRYAVDSVLTHMIAVESEVHGIPPSRNSDSARNVHYIT